MIGRVRKRKAVTGISTHGPDGAGFRILLQIHGRHLKEGAWIERSVLPCMNTTKPLDEVCLV